MAQKTRSPTVAWVQYSKRLASGITFFWCIFRVSVLVLLWFRPSLVSGIENVIRGADDVMMVNVACYCGNSVAEKGISGYFGAKASSAQETNQETDDPGSSNG